MTLSVYTYQSPRRFLAETLAERQRSQPQFSVRQWAKEMGISHSLLLMLLQGKRPIRLKHFPPLAQGLHLSTPERLYFQAMIEFDSATTLEQKNLMQIWLSEMNPGGERRNIELDSFRAISDWIHFGLISFCSVADVPNQPHVLSRRFGNKVTANDIRNAIERLIELKLLEITPEGKLRTTQNHTSSKNDVADRGVKEYHRQVADLARTAVLEQSVSEREFQAFSLPVDPKKIDLAKELIRRFRYQFCEAMGYEAPAGADGSPNVEPNGYEVYQMNLHFFRLTESPSPTNAKAFEVRTADEGVEHDQKPPTHKETPYVSV